MTVPSTSMGRSWMFVPGDRPDRFAKAAAAGADQMILDLEDSVATQHKRAARTAVASWLAAHGRSWVRINGVETAWADDDIDHLLGSPGLQGIVVPKVESSDEVARLRSRLGPAIGMVALIETALGVHHLDSIVASGAINRLAFGAVDFALDVGCEDDEPALDQVRFQLVLASRVGSLAAPLDGVTTEFRDTAKCVADANRARRLGFGGKLCIHPAQVAPVNEAFAATAREVQWAREVVAAAAASDGSVIVVRGAMVDTPIVERATQILRNNSGVRDG